MNQLALTTSINVDTEITVLWQKALLKYQHMSTLEILKLALKKTLQDDDEVTGQQLLMQAAKLFNVNEDEIDNIANQQLKPLIGAYLPSYSAWPNGSILKNDPRNQINISYPSL